MAKGILSAFGRLLIVIGIGIIVGPFFLQGRDAALLLVTIPTGAATLVMGAPFLGFARVIEVLEEIAHNTRSTHLR